MAGIIPLEYGKYYHIYNRGINSCNLFEDKSNYVHFLRLYEKYVDAIANTYAWVLMPNHFHFLIRIKEENEIGFISSNNKPLSGQKATDRVVKITEIPSAVINPGGGYKTKKYRPSNQFSHLFNSYTQAFNKQQNRHGSLFERPFRRKLIENEDYLKYLVYYIHYNPVHHGFIDNITEYEWSSYSTILSSKKSKLMRKDVIGWFNDLNNFTFYHKLQHEMSQANDILIEC